MTTVATIAANAAAEPAVLSGSARSADSSGRFATELSKTTQQVRERHDGQQHATARRSEESESDNGPRIRTAKPDIDQSATQNLVAELDRFRGQRRPWVDLNRTYRRRSRW